MNKMLLAFALCLFASTAHAGGWIYYTDGPYKGKVVELETGEPIEGAVVAGVWTIERYGIYPRFCDAKETLTDKNGEFILPKARCMSAWPFASIDLPSVVVFKPGYLGFPPISYKDAPFTGDEFQNKRTAYVIKLGRPKTREERKLTLNRAESLLYDEAMPELHSLINIVNEENKQLGLKGAYGVTKEK